MKRVLCILACALPLAAQTVRIIQTNAAGDSAHLIDPATNKVTLTIPGLEAAHGVVPAPDGTKLYFTVESDNTVKAADSKTGKILWSVKLSGHPNNLTISKDGRRVFAGISQAPGALDVIDTQTMKNVKTIPLNGGIHNVYVSPDGKYAISGSIGTNIISVVDTLTLEKVWDLKMDSGIRPFTIEAGPDGSTSRIFIQLSNFHGFAVVDFKQRKEVARIEFPKEPVNGTAHSGTPNHGAIVSPDGKYLVGNSHIGDGVFIYTLPDLKYQGFVRTGHVPDWVTFTPDSKMVYVANAADNSVSAVDIINRKEVARIPVGEVPKRNGTVVIK